MRVVLDAYWWARGTQSLQNVLHGVVDAWREQFPEDQLTVVVPRVDVNRAKAELPDVEVVGTRLYPHGLSAMFKVPMVARRSHADLVLTHNFSALFGPRRGVLIQDVMFETSPEWFTRMELLYYRWMTRTARRADVVFSSTDTEGRRIRSFTRAKRVVTAGMGMAPDVVAPGFASEPFEGVAAGSFVLAVGRLNVRKNLAMTIDGALKSGLLTPDFPLLVVGERDGAFEELPASVRSAERDGRVRFTGFLPTAQMRWLVEHCAIYVCLSLDEGFGLPPVEARILGANVIASDIPVFRETMHGTAQLVDPLDAEAVSKAIREGVGGLLRQSSISPERASSLLQSAYDWKRVVGVIRSELAPKGIASA